MSGLDFDQVWIIAPQWEGGEVVKAFQLEAAGHDEVVGAIFDAENRDTLPDDWGGNKNGYCNGCSHAWRGKTSTKATLRLNNDMTGNQPVVGTNNGYGRYDAYKAVSWGPNGNFIHFVSEWYSNWDFGNNRVVYHRYNTSTENWVDPLNNGRVVANDSGMWLDTRLNNDGSDLDRSHPTVTVDASNTVHVFWNFQTTPMSLYYSSLASGETSFSTPDEFVKYVDGVEYPKARPRLFVPDMSAYANKVDPSFLWRGLHSLFCARYAARCAHATGTGQRTSPEPGGRGQRRRCYRPMHGRVRFFFRKRTGLARQHPV